MWYFYVYSICFFTLHVCTRYHLNLSCAISKWSGVTTQLSVLRNAIVTRQLVKYCQQDEWANKHPSSLWWYPEAELFRWKREQYGTATCFARYGFQLWIVPLKGDRCTCFVPRTANPYLAAAAVVAAGIDGIETSLKLPSEVVMDPADMPEHERVAQGVVALPTSLTEAIAELQAAGAASLRKGTVRWGLVTKIYWEGGDGFKRGMYSQTAACNSVRQSFLRSEGPHEIAHVGNKQCGRVQFCAMTDERVCTMKRMQQRLRMWVFRLRFVQPIVVLTELASVFLFHGMYTLVYSTGSAPNVAF